MNILCCCLGGQVRSVALADQLRLIGYNALPYGMTNAAVNPVNFVWYSEWADKIILLVPEEKKRISEKHLDKVTVWDIGNDIWGKSEHPDLKEKVSKWVDENFLTHSE